MSVKVRNDKKYLKGILDVPNDEGEVIGSFLIEIHCSSNYPYRFPILYETGGSIPNEGDWHKYNDGSCCITVQAAEILECRTGVTLLLFITKHVVGFLANYIYKKETNTYKNGEYGHHVMGPFQFYSHLMKTSDFKLWNKYFQHIFLRDTYRSERNVPCFCNSGLKYKNCHSKIFETLKDIGKDQILKDFKNIYKECEEYL